MSSDVEIAASVLDVLATGDPHAADEVLSPGAVLWHNDGTGDLPAEEGFARVGALHELVDAVRVDIVLAEAIPGGAVLRFEVRGTVRSTGEQLCARNCMFTLIVDGRVTRVDEYMDPTFTAQLGL
jgi:uncharacterized protein